MFASLFGGSLLARLIPYAIALAVGGLVVVGIYRTGYRAAERVHQVAIVETKLRTLEADADIARRALAEEQGEVNELRETVQVREERINELRRELELRKSTCTIDDAGLELLRKSAPGGN